MMNWNCEEVEELAGAYALGALPEDEREAVSAHLETCDRHPEMAGLQAAAASLAVAAPEREPSQELKSRLMEAIGGRPTPQRIVNRRRGLGEMIRGWFATPRLGYGLASAMAVLVVGLVAWNVSLQGNDSGTTVLDVRGNASGRVIYLPDDELAVMDLSGLQPLTQTQVYQVWAMTPGSVTSLGVFQDEGNGSAVMSVHVDAGKADQLGITVENAPGSEQPTSNPFVTAQLP